MAAVESQNIDTPHENRPFQTHGHMDVVTLLEDAHQLYAKYGWGPLPAPERWMIRQG